MQVVRQLSLLAYYSSKQLITTINSLNMKAIFAVMNTFRAVVKIRPEKNSGPYGI